MMLAWPDPSAPRSVVDAFVQHQEAAALPEPLVLEPSRSCGNCGRTKSSKQPFCETCLGTVASTSLATPKDPR